MKMKIGDKVWCVEKGLETNLTVGKIYTILGIDDGIGSENKIDFIVDNDLDEPERFISELFETVSN